MDTQKYCGYVYNEDALADYVGTSGDKLFGATPIVPDSGKGKEAFLWEIEQMLTGAVRDPHSQDLGDCVGQGTTGGIEDVQFVQKLKNPAFQFKWISSEYTYSVARVQIGNGACGRQDGAVVAWALKAGDQFGWLPRGKYGEFDLSNYNSHYAKEWGAPGVGAPDSLTQIGKTHLTINAYLVQGQNKFEQCRDAIVNGAVVVTGSNQLYSSQRDSQGFCRPEGNGGHCTYYRGVTDNSKRPGIAYQQSWTKSVPTGGAVQITLPSGKVITIPAGCFLVDADNFERMHSTNDSEVWVIQAVNGWLPPDEEATFSFHETQFVYATAA